MGHYEEIGQNLHVKHVFDAWRTFTAEPDAVATLRRVIETMPDSWGLSVEWAEDHAKCRVSVITRSANQEDLDRKFFARINAMSAGIISTLDYGNDQLCDCSEAYKPPCYDRRGLTQIYDIQTRRFTSPMKEDDDE